MFSGCRHRRSRQSRCQRRAWKYKTVQSGMFRILSHSSIASHLQGVDNRSIVVDRLPHNTLPESFPVKVILTDWHPVRGPLISTVTTAAAPTGRPEEGPRLMMSHVSWGMSISVHGRGHVKLRWWRTTHGSRRRMGKLHID